MRNGYSGGGFVLVLTATILGCSRSEDAGPRANHQPKATQVADNKAHDHSGWWCDEHGVPEAECSM
jgi:hypothetical protein